jgi:shikimate dehydrogenase
VRAYPWLERSEVLAGAALLVNATDRGMAGKEALDLDLARLPADAVVGDIIYTPPVTPLLAAAKARGNATVNGLGLLLNQARPAFQAWFGVMPAIGPELLRSIEATF